MESTNDSRNSRNRRDPDADADADADAGDIHTKKKRKRKKSGQPPIENKEKKQQQIKQAKKNHLHSHLGTDQRKTRKVLNGLTLAISTLECKQSHNANDNDNDNDNDSNSNSNSKIDNKKEEITYKKACGIAEELGAVTTAQVHNRVFAVICNKSAIQQSTQRVRKALKKCIPLIDIQWLLKCQETRQRVAHEDYLLTNEANLVVVRREKIAKDALVARISNSNSNHNSNEVDVEDESDDEILNASIGWSEPVSLDCCCVCHDDDRDDCKWCSGEEKCNVILKKFGLTSNDDAEKKK